MEKNIIIECEFCDNWFIDKKTNAFEKCLVNKLKNLGYYVNFKIIPINSTFKPYYIYIIINKERKLVFSNNASLHRKEGAIIDYCLNDSNVKKVIEKIKNVINNNI
jgi:hypothetical protein